MTGFGITRIAQAGVGVGVEAAALVTNDEFLGWRRFVSGFGVEEAMLANACMRCEAKMSFS